MEKKDQEGEEVQQREEEDQAEEEDEDSDDQEEFALEVRGRQRFQMLREYMRRLQGVNGYRGLGRGFRRGGNGDPRGPPPPAPPSTSSTE